MLKSPMAFIKSILNEHHQLQPYNTFNVKAIARYFSEVQSTDDLQKIIADPFCQELPKLILGGGSNILFTRDYPGIVINNAIRGITLIQEDDQHIWLKVAAGERWHDLVMYCLVHNYAGVENLSLIPGTVGAAPIQNIGAYGVEFESVFDSLDAIHLLKNESHSFSKKDCEFGYRDSIFKNKHKNSYIITYVTLKLNKTPDININYSGIKNLLTEKNISYPSIRDISDAIIEIRQQKLPDPQKLPNVGSFFKNPVVSKEFFQQLKLQFSDIPGFSQTNGDIKIPAAWLIEHCHLKGITQNGVGISKNHALIIVNYDNPDGKAALALSQKIQYTVQEKFGILIQPEVNIY